MFLGDRRTGTRLHPFASPGTDTPLSHGTLDGKLSTSNDLSRTVERVRSPIGQATVILVIVEESGRASLAPAYHRHEHPPARCIPHEEEI